MDDGPRRDYKLPNAVPFENHGKTIAGWVLFWAVCIGGAITGLGLILWEMWVVVVGAAIIVVGIIVSIVMSAVGLGQPRNRERAAGAGEADWYA